MMNLSSFRDYLNQANPSVILYNSENNEDQSIYDPVTMCLMFESISVHFHPNTVTLKGNGGIIRFRYVTKVDIKIDDTALGDTVTLFCSNDEYKTSYTLIMRSVLT